MKIPKTSIRTTWKADWLIEFSIAFLVLGTLTREIIFIALGAGVTLALACGGFIFSQKLTLLRMSLRVQQHLSRTRVFLGDNVEGKLTIRNLSKLTAHMKTVQPAVEERLRFTFSSSFDRIVLPGTEATSEFTITPFVRGHFGIACYRLKFTDGRDLFTGELTLDSIGAGSVEVYPGVGIVEPLTPLGLYGGGLDTLRKAPSGPEYAGIRPYAPGDDYHRVEWKATARLRTLMVKEFHPETEATLQVLIDAGKTMHRQSYVGTRFDEALAVAELLIESVMTSRTMVGIWIFDETRLVKILKPALAKEQIHRFRESSLTLQTEKWNRASPTPLSAPRTLPPLRSSMPNGERVVAFLQLLTIRLGLIHRQTGAYKAFTEARQEAGRGILIVITDLENSTEGLLEAVSGQPARSKIMVAQMGAAWRLNDDLEQAYVEYQRNDRILRRLERFGLPVFDLRPEALLETLVHQIARAAFTISVRQ